MKTICDCNVAVVGGAGFLGSHISEYLISARRCKVLIIDNLVAGRREFVPYGASFVHTDITQSESHLYNLFKKYQIRCVFNYAASPYVPDSYSRPVQVCQINAVGAMHVINAAQAAGCDGILQVSSAEVYGNASEYLSMMGSTENINTRIREDHPVQPHSSYGASKAMIDSWVQVRWKEARTPCIALRQFNCIGERETHPYVVPEIISQIDRGGLHLRLGNNSERDFLYAGDQARMAVELLEKGQFGEVYNLGSERSVKIYNLAQMIAEVMGLGEHVKITQEASRIRPWEIWYLQSDNSKIYKIIDARPTLTLEQSLLRTVRYYRENGRRWCWET